MVKYSDIISQYQYLGKIYEIVENSYPQLGKLVILETITATSNETLAVIGISGTGKSRALQIVKTLYQGQALLLDAITINGLEKISKKLDNNQKLLLIDDLSKGATDYAQIMTLMTLAELVYSKFVEKYTHSLELRISNFNGSAIINIQPLLYRKVLLAPEFETDIRDKTIRYFHMSLPRETNIIPANDELNKMRRRIDFTTQVKIDTDNPLYRKIVSNFRNEHSLTRAEEHTIKLLRGIALLDNRTETKDIDYQLLYNYSKNFQVELEITEKKALEGLRKLDINIIAILTVINSYGKVKVDELCKIFQVKRSTMYNILAELGDYVILFQQKGLVLPTDKTKKLLKEVRIE
jgi:hypothetical protein